MLRKLLHFLGFHQWGEWREQLGIFDEEEEKGPQTFHSRWCLVCDAEDEPVVFEDEADETQTK